MHVLNICMFHFNIRLLFNLNILISEGEGGSKLSGVRGQKIHDFKIVIHICIISDILRKMKFNFRENKGDSLESPILSRCLVLGYWNFYIFVMFMSTPNSKL